MIFLRPGLFFRWHRCFLMKQGENDFRKLCILCPPFSSWFLIGIYRGVLEQVSNTTTKLLIVSDLISAWKHCAKAPSWGHPCSLALLWTNRTRECMNDNGYFSSSTENISSTYDKVLTTTDEDLPKPCFQKGPYVNPCHKGRATAQILHLEPFANPQNRRDIANSRRLRSYILKGPRVNPQSNGRNSANTWHLNVPSCKCLVNARILLIM